MEEYNIKIEHVIDGKLVSTDYATITEEEYITIERILTGGPIFYS